MCFFSGNEDVNNLDWSEIRMELEFLKIFSFDKKSDQSWDKKPIGSPIIYSEQWVSLNQVWKYSFGMKLFQPKYYV